VLQGLTEHLPLVCFRDSLSTSLRCASGTHTITYVLWCASGAHTITYGVLQGLTEHLRCASGAHTLTYGVLQGLTEHLPPVCFRGSLSTSLRCASGAHNITCVLWCASGAHTITYGVLQGLTEHLPPMCFRGSHYHLWCTSKTPCKSFIRIITEVALYIEVFTKCMQSGGSPDITFMSLCHATPRGGGTEPSTK